MKTEVEGIILSEINYLESSKILNILTKEYGLISVISKGSRKIKSKLRGISMKLVYGKFIISYKDGGLSTLIEGSLVNSFKNIITNFENMLYANKLINNVKNILKDNNDKNMFFILRDSLLKINEGFNGEIISIIAYIKFLDFLGVRPNFNNCVICGNSNIYTFDLEKGGFVCQECYQDTYLFLKETLKLLKLFQYVDISKIEKLNISKKEVLDELNLFVEEYYEKYTGVYLNLKK